MKKIVFAFCILAALKLNAQVNLMVTAPNASLSNGTTGLRAPNGNASHTSLRACYFVPASELSALSSTITSFGFVLTNTLVSAPANGTITVYLMTTSASSYGLGTAWSTATVGMTQVYNGVYNLPTGSTATVVDFPFPVNFNYIPGNGLYVAYEYKGGQFASNNAVYSAFTNSAVTAGATNASPTLPAVETLSTTTFRPLFRFGHPNTLSNDLSIQFLNAMGKVSQQTGTSQQISATLFNGSNTGLTNIPVDLTINGTNSFTASVTIPSLAAGAQTNVVFPAYNPSLPGLSNIIVSVPNDQNNANNTRNITQSVTCNVIGTGPTSVAPVSYSSGVGFNTGSGKILSQFQTASTETLIGTYLAISSGINNIGKSVYAIVTNSNGVALATSNTLTISSAELDTYQYFGFNPIVFNANTNYHVGIVQPQGSPGYFPLGACPAPNAPPYYSTQSFTGTVLNPLTTNLGYFGIEPVFMTSLCSMVGLSDNSNTKDLSLKIYPNPAKDKLTLDIENVSKEMILQVTNMLGQVVLQKDDLSEKTILDVSTLPKGIYCLSLVQGKMIQSSKLVID